MNATSTTRSARADETEALPSDASDEPILEAIDVERAFGSVRVLEGTTLSVPANAVTALIGPNGTGKSTLLRILVGLLEPDDGRVTYCGPDVPRPIGYLPQRPDFRPGFTVIETLDFYARLVGEQDPDTDGILELVGLQEARDTRVDALSGGMTRLLGLAQATVGDPPVIVLDEPASGLDPGMRTRVYETIAELAENDAGVLVTTHDLELADRHADRVALLDAGRVQVVGPPSEVRAEIEVDTLQEVYDAYTTSDERTVTVRREEA